LRILALFKKTHTPSYDCLCAERSHDLIVEIMNILEPKRCTLLGAAEMVDASGIEEFPGRSMDNHVPHVRRDHFLPEMGARKEKFGKHRERKCLNDRVC
jgi:hypothetical protein